MQPHCPPQKSTTATYRLLHILSTPYNYRAVYFSFQSQHTSVQYATLKDTISLFQEVGQGAGWTKDDIGSAQDAKSNVLNTPIILGNNIKFKPVYITSADNITNYTSRLSLHRCAIPQQSYIILSFTNTLPCTGDRFAIPCSTLPGGPTACNLPYVHIYHSICAQKFNSHGDRTN